MVRSTQFKDLNYIGRKPRQDVSREDGLPDVLTFEDIEGYVRKKLGDKGEITVDRNHAVYDPFYHNGEVAGRMHLGKGDTIKWTFEDMFLIFYTKPVCGAKGSYTSLRHRYAIATEYIGSGGDGDILYAGSSVKQLVDRVANSLK